MLRASQDDTAWFVKLLHHKSDQVVPSHMGNLVRCGAACELRLQLIESLFKAISNFFQRFRPALHGSYA